MKRIASAICMSVVLSGTAHASVSAARFTTMLDEIRKVCLPNGGRCPDLITRFAAEISAARVPETSAVTDGQLGALASEVIGLSSQLSAAELSAAAAALETAIAGAMADPVAAEAVLIIAQSLEEGAVITDDIVAEVSSAN